MLHCLGGSPIYALQCAVRLLHGCLPVPLPALALGLVFLQVLVLLPVLHELQPDPATDMSVCPAALIPGTCQWKRSTSTWAWWH